MALCQGPDASATGERQICCSLTSVLIRTVRATAGEAAVREMLTRAGNERDQTFLENTDNWISLRETLALLQAGVDVTGDPNLSRRVGADTVRQHAGSQVATLLRSLGSPEAVLGSMTATAGKFSTVSRVETVSSGPGHAVVRAVGRNGFTRDRLLCDWTTGLLCTPPMLFGLPPGRVEEVECQARGGCECRYVITWDAELAAEAVDPEKRITELEAQVAAMAARLESAYATASDLVSADSLDVVLTRIVERAANAVRAPGYVLAVKTEPEGPLRVFSEGLSDEEASRIASGSRSGSDEEVLSVDVASSRNHYGLLAAVHPAGSHFFAQEGQLLTLYAKHAAAVLDTATALEEASHRNRNVSALLSLSQALAQAGATDEIVARLRESVLEVIDCDISSVWTWDEDSDGLRTEDGSGAGLIRGAQTPYVEQMLRDPRPLFFTESGEDPLLVAIMTDPRLVAMAVVPIIAREVFLGLLSVGVRERPERLAPSAGLTEQLSGVAALAATALQNGRLIDELARQVVHDGLTGVLNRRGFGRTIDAALTQAANGGNRVGLLFVDLDDFKSLNDQYGHGVGDEALRVVAQRLQATFRSDDVVARLGGDEFAIVLRHVTSEADVKRGADRVAAALAQPLSLESLSLPLSACVGSAVAPEDGLTIDELLRHADQAMYRGKALARAAHNGGDRVLLSSDLA